jgi:hypothetical protein
MTKLYLVLEFVTVGFAFVAAWFWFRSSQSFAPEIDTVSIASLKTWLDASAWFNRAATLCAGISATAQGMTYVAIPLGA